MCDFSGTWKDYFVNKLNLYKNDYKNLIEEYKKAFDINETVSDTTMNNFINVMENYLNLDNKIAFDFGPCFESMEFTNYDLNFVGVITENELCIAFYEFNKLEKINCNSYTFILYNDNKLIQNMTNIIAEFVGRKNFKELNIFGDYKINIHNQYEYKINN